MNPFAGLTREIASRPGDPLPKEKREKVCARRRAIGLAAYQKGLGIPPAIDNPWGLTYQQAQVLQLTAEGLSNAETATAMGVCVKTIEKHSAGAKAKLGASNLAQAAVLWDRFVRQPQAEAA